jgi:hypothetical protein
VTESDIARLIAAGRAVLEDGSTEGVLSRGEEYSALLDQVIASGFTPPEGSGEELLRIHDAVMEVVSEASNRALAGSQLEGLRRFGVKAYLSQIVRGGR